MHINIYVIKIHGFTGATCCLLIAQEGVERIQFTSTAEYIVLNDKKKVAKLSLTDPDPLMPEQFQTDNEDIFQGDYLLVDITSLKNLQKGNRPFQFLQSAREILTKEWEDFDDDMDIDALTAADEDFLLYYQRIDTTTKSCRTKTTSRAKGGNNKRRASGKDEVVPSDDDDDNASNKKPRRSTRSW
jgi:hypothetical protein